MQRIATQAVDVVVEGLLEMYQCALARAVGPVLECGEGDGVRIVHGRDLFMGISGREVQQRA